MWEYILVSRITQTSSHKLINESIRTTNQLGCVILIRRQDQPDCQVITILQQRITINDPVQTKKKKESSEARMQAERRSRRSGKATSQIK